MTEAHDPDYQTIKYALYGLWTGISDGLSLADLIPRMMAAERALKLTDRPYVKEKKDD